MTDTTTWRDCRCGAKIEAAPSGTYWVDVEGWDTCIGTDDSHEPIDTTDAQGATMSDRDKTIRERWEELYYSFIVADHDNSAPMQALLDYQTAHGLHDATQGGCRPDAAPADAPLWPYKNIDKPEHQDGEGKRR